MVFFFEKISALTKAQELVDGLYSVRWVEIDVGCLMGIFIEFSLGEK